MTVSAVERSPQRTFAEQDVWPGDPVDIEGPSCVSRVKFRRLWRDVRSLKLSTAREAPEASELGLIPGCLDAPTVGWGDLYAVHAMSLTLDDDTISAAAVAEQALRSCPTAPFARLSRLVLRFCAWKAGAATQPEDNSTLDALQATGDVHVGAPADALIDVLDLTLAAAIALSQLRITTAERFARCALRRAEQTPLMGVSPAGVLGRILYAQGRAAEAEQLIAPCLPRIRSLGSLDCVAEAYGVLVGAAANAGDYATASAILDEACALAEARNWPRLMAAMLAERVRLCDPESERHALVWLGQLANLAQRHRSRARCARSEIVGYGFRAQIYAFLKFRTGAPPSAALAHLHHDAWLGRDLRALFWVKLAECQVLWVLGDEASALANLVKVLRTAEAAGLRQPLVDAGATLYPLIERLVQDQGLKHDLLAFSICLLEHLGQGFGEPRSACRRRAGVGGDRLTDRERDVLKLIGEGHTNKLIAQRQGVAPETIKTHVKNIFLKLGVERRAQAVVKAVRLGMI